MASDTETIQVTSGSVEAGNGDERTSDVATDTRYGDASGSSLERRRFAL